LKISFIELEGFRGIRAHQKLYIPDGFVIITGRNGTGKSTICDAVEFALTGGVSKYGEGHERGESTDQYMWWRGRQPATKRLVRIGFRDESGNEFTVSRTPEQFEVNGVARLDAALCDPKVMTRNPLAQICRTAIIRDEKIAALSIDLAEADRFNFVSTALGTDALEDTVERGKKVLASLKTRIATAEDSYMRARDRVNALVSERSELKGKIREAPDVGGALIVIERIVGASTDGSVATQLSHARRWVLETRRQKDARVAIAQEIDFVNVEIENLNRPTSEKLAYEAVTRREQLQHDIGNLVREQEALAVRIGAYQHFAAIRAPLASLYEAGKALGLQNGCCPLCGTHLGAGQYNSALKVLSRELDVADREAATMRQQMADLEKNLQEKRSEFHRADQEIRLLYSRRDDLSKRLERLQLQASRYLSPDKSAVSSVSLRASVDDTAAAIEIVANAITALEASVILDQAADVERRLGMAQAESDRLERELRGLEAAQDLAKRLLNGIRRSVGELVEERLAALDPLLRDLYARLRPHTEWVDLSYRVRGDVKRFLSLRVGEEINPRFTFSSGQRRAIGLAFLLAVHLSRPWCRLETLVLDDPVQHIDDFRSLHLVEVMSAIRKTGQQVICAVEDKELADLMCRRMRTASSAEGSIVEMGFRPGDGAVVERASPISGAIRHMLLPS
jgi:chromosome segregation protein